MISGLNKGTFQDAPIHRRLKLDTLYTFFYQEKEPGFLFSGEAHPLVELTYVDTYLQKRERG